MKIKMPKLWYKKRTSRGRGRTVRNRPKLSAKNVRKNAVKNQELYSHFFLKFALFAICAVFWIKIPPIAIGSFVITVFPIGLAVGTVLLAIEKFRIGRGVEIAILLVMCVASYLTPIGIVI